ncbi:hypothetical protein B0H14DRAFT_3525881 [Mycena olivaceomarginata]|nr:hypothetical protein B0H14DRAFT_3525881 [Mycena olivaceomarginata]
MYPALAGGYIGIKAHLDWPANLYLIVMYLCLTLFGGMAGKPIFLCYFLFTGNPNLAVTPVFSLRRSFRALSALKYPQKTFFGRVPSAASIWVRSRCAPVCLGFVYIPSPSSSRKAPPENELPWAGPAHCDCDRENAELDTFSQCLLCAADATSPTLPLLRAADAPAPASPHLPSLFYRSHPRSCLIPIANPALDNGEGIKYFWGKPFRGTDTYVVKTVWALSAPLSPSREIPRGCHQVLPGDFRAAGRSVAGTASGSNAFQHGRAALLCIEDRLARAHRRLTAAVLLQAQCARADDESAGDATPCASRLKMLRD